MNSASYAAPSSEGIQTYQKNVHASPERKQSLQEDIDRYRNADELWEVLRTSFTLPHHEDNPEVKEQINWFMHHQDYLMECTYHAVPYLYYILQQAKKRHLPAEVVLLPMIESAYNPFAYSSAGAGGMWQIMSSTASDLGIKHNRWYDGRRDVVASTRAALNHLAYLGNFFEGNWLLALGAYNTGEGNILSAIHKNIRNGNQTDFWSLPVAQQTRTYVPRILALAIIISHPERYPIHFPSVRNAPYLAQVDVGSQIDLKKAANLAGMTFKKLRQLNPAYNNSATGPNGPFKLILPIENVAQFTENLADASPQSGHHLELDKELKQDNTENKLLALTQQKPTTTEAALSDSLKNLRGHYTLQPGDTLYMVRKGDDLPKIAKHFHTTTLALQLANQLLNAKHLNPGEKLVIPTHEPTQQAKNYQLAPGDTVYMVRKNDTIETIANKFNTTPAAIRVMNLLASSEVIEGDRLVIPTHI
ncbi:hypothetical protein AYO45_05685 [Gammaproteobacteria bacterium SCGC AG-212-F23]|nr:hypothetical protein AYO45_05685 [Gammaproteobacteria bacterium SCGC AG-212-F23]